MGGYISEMYLATIISDLAHPLSLSITIHPIMSEDQGSCYPGNSKVNVYLIEINNEEFLHLIQVWK